MRSSNQIGVVRSSGSLIGLSGRFEDVRLFIVFRALLIAFLQPIRSLEWVSEQLQWIYLVIVRYNDNRFLTIANWPPELIVITE